MASQAFEGLVAAPFVTGLHALGWGGDAPLWLLLGTLLVAQVSTNEDVQRWLGGPDLSRHTHARVASQVALGTGVMYLVGWGPVLASALVMVLANHLKWGVRPEIWRVVFGWSVVWILCGQAAISAGLIVSYVASPGASALAGLNLVLLFLVMRLLGVMSAERLAAEETVRTNERRFRALVQNSTDVVLITDASAVPIYASPSATRITGRAPEELVGADPYALVHPDDHQAMDEVLAAVRRHPGAQGALELRSRHPDGGWRWVEAVVRNLLDEPAVGGLVINYRDTTERRALSDKLRHEAFHDSLTGLANRALFSDRLAQAVLRPADGGAVPVVMLIDIDDFKSVNDSLGHAAGDALLVDLAGSLAACVRPGDTVARLGGDEFAVLIEGVDDPTQVERWAERVLRAVQRDVDLAGRRVPVTASIGVIAGQVGGSPDGLLRDADVAMYVAKAEGKGRFTVFRTGMSQAVHSRLQLKADLAEALAAGDQLVLDYQPVLELSSGRVSGVEALLRWNHPTRGRLAPAAFLWAAEETGLAVPLGLWTLREACSQLAVWQRSGPSWADVWVSVNLSLGQICGEPLLHDLDSTLAATGIDPSHLVLEVRETALVRDASRTGSVLAAIRARGVKVGVDDFGSSSSSLSYLSDFPVDLLKIDRSFASDAAEDNSVLIVQTIVELAGRLSVPVVAQGIESLACAARLRAISCTYGQGELFAAPGDPTRVAALVERLNAPAVPIPRTHRQALEALAR